MEIKSKYRTSMVNGDIILEIESDYKEAIEALEKIKKNLENAQTTERQIKAIAYVMSSEELAKGIIEKAYGEIWEDIRRYEK